MIELTEQEIKDNVELNIFSYYGGVLLDSIKAQDLPDWLLNCERIEGRDFWIDREPPAKQFTLSKPIPGENIKVTVHYELLIKDKINKTAAYLKDGKWHIIDAEAALDSMSKMLNPIIYVDEQDDRLLFRSTQPVNIATDLPHLHHAGVNAILIKKDTN